MNVQDNMHNLPVWSEEKLKSSVKQFNNSEKIIYKTHVIENQYMDQFLLKHHGMAWNLLQTTPSQGEAKDN